MMKQAHILVQLVLLVAVFVAVTLAIDVAPVGTIDDNLFAPTSLYVQDDELAVLEPFSEQLKIFTADGVLVHEVQLTGNAMGLVKISPWIYLYCDRDRNKVVAVHSVNGAQYDYLQGAVQPTEPIDILAVDNAVLVLDAASGSIHRFNETDGSYNRIDIVEVSASPRRYFSSFAYDPARDRFYVLDQLNSQILAVEASGSVVGLISRFGNAEGEITRGGDLTVDRDGRIYVSDRFQGRVTVFSSDGRYLDEIDPFNGAAAVPTGIEIDHDGVLYVASTARTGIRMFFVPPAPSFDEAVQVIQRYPDQGAVLSADEVRLVAVAERSDETREVRGFDFEIFRDTLGPATIEYTEAEPVAQTAPDQPGQTFSAEWILETDLDDDQIYYWRTRVRSDLDLGEWSDFRMFRTVAIPEEYHLSQNFPNPFNPATRISFTLPSSVDVKLTVFNLLGQKVKMLADGHYPAGGHTVDWDGTDESGQVVSTGVYFYRLGAENFVQTRKMVLIK